jgi:hypothetical protein
MNFSDALKELKNGKKLQRSGWNGKNLFVYLVSGGDYKVQMDCIKPYADNNGCVHYEPYFAIKNVKNTINTWMPSVSDILANDWEVID